ncbi:MAG: GGDEF domain-containing protein [Thermodesulforhabdaceae bacterium]
MKKPLPWVEKLSQVIVDIVRNLESRGEPITAEKVAYILASDSSLISLSSEFYDQNQVLSARSSHIKIVQELEEEYQKMVELFQSTIATISPFLHLPNISKVSKQFDSFREKLRNGASLDQLEKAFNTFKEAVLQHGIEPVEEKKGIKKLFGFLQKDHHDNIEELKIVLSEIINSINPLIPETLQEKWAAIRDVFYKINHFHDITSWNATFAEFLKTLILHIDQEQKELNKFISELGQNLIEIEKNILASLDHVHLSQESSNKLNYHIDGQINDLRQSVAISSNLKDLQKMVIMKLSYIKQALEQKRKQEEEYNKELEERIQKLQQDLNTINDQIKVVQSREQRLAEEALKDPLTGITNRRGYELRIAEEWERFKRYGHIFSLAIFDLDHFKNINDSYGHKAGDLILKEVARIMKSSLRKGDIIARYGGEEFVVIFTGTQLNGAVEAAEKLRRIIEKTKFVFRGKEISITISAGVSQVEATDESFADVFDRADKALYAAKNSGRNKVISSPAS